MREYCRVILVECANGAHPRKKQEKAKRNELIGQHHSY